MANLKQIGTILRDKGNLPWSVPKAQRASNRGFNVGMGGIASRAVNVSQRSPGFYTVATDDPLCSGLMISPEQTPQNAAERGRYFALASSLLTQYGFKCQWGDPQKTHILVFGD